MSGDEVAGEVVLGGLADAELGAIGTEDVDGAGAAGSNGADSGAAGADGVGAGTLRPDGAGALVVDMNGTSRAAVVAALVNAGVGVDRVMPKRRLEDAFLSLVGGDTKASGER